MKFEATSKAVQKATEKGLLKKGKVWIDEFGIKVKILEEPNAAERVKIKWFDKKSLNDYAREAYEDRVDADKWVRENYNGVRDWPVADLVGSWKHIGS